MRWITKTALAIVLGTAVVAGPSVAHARHWRPYHRHHAHHHGFHVPGPLIGLGIAGAVLGTVAIVDSIVRPPRVVYAPPPPPHPYDEGYRRGYDDGRRDSYDDGYRRRY